ncbi:GNAT family N-acetyltransferase [Streptomyces sp. NPDC091292]|uniref:GNAT family N-acetyltransferase n=1 Tax=Streptomyces sp. NPDC091292 TaxID=3365991 RepID=UPI0038116224
MIRTGHGPHTDASVRRVSGTGLLARADGVRAVYADAFAGAPWHDGDAEAEAYVRRLAGEVTRPGFAAALALDGEKVRGFATGWVTPADFPDGPGYAQVASIGPGRAAAWLCGAVRIDELAVAEGARGRGLGAALLDTVASGAPDGRCWLVTSVRAEATVRFYRRLGWHQVTDPAPGGTELALFLGPVHPGLHSGAGPVADTH